MTRFSPPPSRVLALTGFILWMGAFAPQAIAVPTCGDGILEVGELCEAPFEECCDPLTCQFETTARVCRSSAGTCDVVEFCTGSSPTCPDDAFEPSTAPCSGDSQGDLCDDDTADHCSGIDASCIDVFLPPSHQCRPGSGDPESTGVICDPAESCSGSSGECPDDVVAPAGTVCNPGSGDACDPDETCSGIPGEACQADVYEDAIFVCRVGSGDACDPDETCPGTPDSACPTDVLEAAGAVCREGGGDPEGTGFICDPAETCSGIAGDPCPDDSFADAAVVCKAGTAEPDPTTSACDPPEFCPGTAGGVCPADFFEPADTICRPGGAIFGEASFSCDVSEHCPGVAGGTCAPDVQSPPGSSVLLRATADARIMETHRTSNSGAAALMWVKRSPHGRALVGFDTTCQGSAMADLECGVLELSIHDGLPTNAGSEFMASLMEVSWKEGNQAFDDFVSAGEKLGTFPGSGEGTTWGCRVDLDLGDSGTHNCSDEERWIGGSNCPDGSSCFDPSGALAPYTDPSQTEMTWDISSDVRGEDRPISWIIRTADETSAESGAAKFYQKDGAQFIAETDSSWSASRAFGLGPRLHLFGPGLAAPEAVVVEPANLAAVGDTMVVNLDQTGTTRGGLPRWENKTLGTWGYLDPGVVTHWQGEIPLQEGANEVEFTVFDACGTEGTATFELHSVEGVGCGNGATDPGEECDDGNTVGGDCCAGDCTLEPDGSVCDDANVCTQASSCQSGVCQGTPPAPIACEDSHLCFRTSTSKKAQRFPTLPDFPVAEPFGTQSVDLRTAQSLCLPTTIAGRPVQSPDSHYVGYLARTSDSTSIPPVITVTDLFGTFEMIPNRVGRIFVPSGMELDGAAQALPSGTDDYRVCYRIRNMKPSLPRDLVIETETTLGTKRYRPIRPTRLCLASEADGTPALNPASHRTCYRVLRAPGETPHAKVASRIHTSNDLGDLRLDTRKEEELCVPAILVDAQP
jgi:cysteine-rich repeat protein